MIDQKTPDLPPVSHELRPETPKVLRVFQEHRVNARLETEKGRLLTPHEKAMEEMRQRILGR